jgi:hypothetical protein
MNKPGEKVTQWVDDQNLVIFNDGSIARIDANTGNTTALDVTKVPATILTSSHWVLVDQITFRSLPLSPYLHTEKQHSQRPGSTQKPVGPNLQTYFKSMVQVEHHADDNIDHYLEKKNQQNNLPGSPRIHSQDIRKKGH